MVEDVDDGTVAMAWASALIDTLTDTGVDTAVVAPGSRSTPLVLAAADHDDITVLSQLDERSAGFFALGRGRTTDLPTAVITTSGTATANLYPAVIEAYESRVPLLLLTADRPPEQLDSGANQTIRQDNLYGTFTRWHRTLGEPSLEPDRLRSVRATAARAVTEAIGPPAGAVHLNLPFRKPLEPADPADRQTARRLGVGSTPRITRPTQTVDQATIHEIAARIDARDRRLLVVGPAQLDPTTGSAILELATAADMAVFADPASGLRFHHGRNVTVCGGYDGYLEAIEPFIGTPDVAIRIGPEPTSATLRSHLDVDGCTQLLIDPQPAWRDATYRLDAILRGDVAETARSLAAAITQPGESMYVETIERAERRYWETLSASYSEHYFEGAIAAHVAETLSADALLFIGNSMPIRDLDRFARPRRRGPEIIANRGVSGIDGNASTALGAAHGADRPVVALLGDLATYHDMNGLLAIDRFGIDASIVVVNNDGGGIFHMLPIEEHDPPFEQLFRTPHGLEFKAVAELYGLDYRRVQDRPGLERVVTERLETGGQLVECRVDANRSHRMRERITERIAETVSDEVR